MDGLFQVAVGGAISLVTALSVVALTHTKDRGRDRLDDERRLRDAKFLRLRDDYVRLLYAAEVLVDVTHEAQFLIEGESAEERDARLQRSVNQALADLGQAQIRLSLEEGTDAVLDAFQKAYGGFVIYQIDRTSQKRYPDSVPVEEIRKNRGQIQEGARALKAAAREHLLQLQRPLPGI